MSDEQTIEKQTYTVREAATILGVSQATIYQAIKDDLLPAIHIGRSVRISRAVIERALAGDLPVTASGRERMRTPNVGPRSIANPDEWAERLARELEIRARVKGGDLY